MAKNNPDTLKKYRIEYMKRPEVIARRSVYMANYRKTPEALERARVRSRERMRRIREEVLIAYGGKCSECPENRWPCLEIDHINNDGAAHRREIGSHGSSALTQWLYRKGCPKDGFRLLCGNCHRMKHYRRWELTQHA